MKETKVCSKCGEAKPFPDSFFRDKHGRDGYKPYCKPCDYSYRRKRNTRDLREYMRKYRAENRERFNEEKRIYHYERYHSDPEYREWRLQKQREYRQTPKGRARMKRAKARRRANGGRHTLTARQWKRTLDAFDNQCAYCGACDDITRDHFIPLALGGDTVMGNMVPACARCNSSKQHFRPRDWCSDEQLEYVRGILDSLK